jgi:hypothetical protein
LKGSGIKRILRRRVLDDTPQELRVCKRACLSDEAQGLSNIPLTVIAPPLGSEAREEFPMHAGFVVCVRVGRAG